MPGKAFRTVLPTLLIALTLAAPASAQSAADVLQTAMSRYEDRMSGIDNYTTVIEVMGTTVTNYFEKQMVDGHPVFVLKDRSGRAEGAGMFYNGFMEVIDRATLAGDESIDGHDCHVVNVDDFSGVDFDPTSTEDEENFRPEKGTFYLDSDSYVLRRMVMDGQSNQDGKWQPITMQIDFKDYREVDGMLHPFLAEMNFTGINNTMSEEEMQEARESLEQMKKQLAEMPASQRAAVERMLGPKMEQLEEMLNSGSIQMTTEVKELKVNSGPPN